MLVFEPIKASWEGGLVKSQVPFGRARIPGGWLVALMSGTVSAQLTLCFVPDPEHRWDGSSLPETTLETGSRLDTYRRDPVWREPLLEADDMMTRTIDETRRHPSRE